MIHAKNYETVFKFVKVMPRKLVTSFFLDTVYKPNVKSVAPEIAIEVSGVANPQFWGRGAGEAVLGPGWYRSKER